MKKANDSFLELIGMNASSMVETKEDLSSVPAVEEPSSTNEQSRPGSLVQEFLGEDAEPFEQFAERTEVDEVQYESAEEPTENTDPEEASQTEIYDEETHQEPTENTDPEEASQTEIYDEETHQPSDRTGIYGEAEERALVSDLQQDVAFEDRLLEGLEEAEASRATDVYAKSFRADSRRTRAHGKDESFIDFEDASTVKSKFQVDAENVQEDPGSKTLVLSDEIEGIPPEELEPFTKKISEDELLPDGADDPSIEDPSVEDPFAAIDDDGLYKTVEKERGSGASRKTVAFEYSKDSDQEEAKYFLIPIADSPVSEPIAVYRLPYSIGRDQKNNFPIPDDSNASRFHAELRDVQGALVVVDLNSTNGVQVNGESVTECVLAPGDLLQVGNLKVRISSAAIADATVANVAESGFETVLTSQGNKKKKKAANKRRIVLSLVVSLLAVVYLGTRNRDAVIEFLRPYIIQHVQSELSSLPDEVATDLGRPINEAEPEDVKALVVNKLNQFPLPDDFKAYLDQVPARLYQIILADPELSKALIENNGNITMVFGLLRTKMIDAFNNNRNEEALELVELFLQDAPNNEELLGMQKELKNRMSFVQLEQGRVVTAAEKEDFVRIMNDHNKTYEEFVDASNYEGAKDYAEKLLIKLGTLIKQRPHFEEYAASAITEWRGKVKRMDKAISERNERREKIQRQDQKGDAAISEIEKLLEAQNLAMALKKVREFVASYPAHPDYQDIAALKDYLPVEMEKVVASARDKINELSSRENFKQAWDLYYSTADNVGADFKSLAALKVDLESKTAPRGAQYYNQARVFEFEADDLVAAEQYYKKTIETVDPRGELADKASRRYEAVKRKNLQ